MKNSRKDGIVALTLKGGYEWANQEGKLEKKKGIVGKTPVYAVDGICSNLESFLTSALFDFQIRMKERGAVEQANPGSEEDQFFTKESPTAKEVKEQANVLAIAVNGTTAFKTSDFMKEFEGIVNAGLIETDTGHKIKTASDLWQSMTRKDRENIAFTYCAFFVNPLESLSES